MLSSRRTISFKFIYNMFVELIFEDLSLKQLTLVMYKIQYSYNCNSFAISFYGLLYQIFMIMPVILSCISLELCFGINTQIKNI